MKKWLFICLILSAFLCSGCEKIATGSYDIEDYQMQEDKSLYSFSGQLSDMEHVVAAAMYGENDILLYEELLEGNRLNKKIWSFSYLTGEKKILSNLMSEVQSDYVSSPDRFEILSTKPFVLMDIYDGQLIVYTDDFSGISTMNFEEYPTPNGIFVRDGKLFIMDFYTNKVYEKLNLTEYIESFEKFYLLT